VALLSRRSAERLCRDPVEALVKKVGGEHMRLASKLNLSLRYGAGILGLRDSDVILTSFPRSGSTWLRFILGNYLSLQELGGTKIDLMVLDDIMPALGRYNMLKPWSYSSIPRFVKTHWPYSRWLARPKASIQILRDPRDVMVSYFHFLRYHQWITIPDDFGLFIRHPKFGLPLFFAHYSSWQVRNPYIVRYEALKEDAYSAVAQMLESQLSSIDTHHLHEAIARSSLREMQNVERTSGISGPARFSDQFRIVRSGSSRQWPEYFSDDDLDYYLELCKANDFTVY
jgi:hypothetical protein